MTTPRNTFDPQGNEYEPYPSTSHPEDRGFNVPADGYPTSSLLGSYSGSYAGYSSGTSSAGEQKFHKDLKDPFVEHAGKADIFAAIEYGFRIVFKKPLWILGAFLILAVVGVGTATAMYLSFGASGGFEDPSAVPDPSIRGTDFLVNFGSILIAAFGIRLVLLQLDGLPITLGEVFTKARWLKTTATEFLIFILLLIPMGISLAVLFVTAFNLQTGGSWVPFVLVLVLILVVATFISPFFTYAPYFVCDGRASVIEGIRLGFVQVSKNYWQAVGFSVFNFLISTFGLLITLGLGAIIIVPAMMNAQAHMYRQIAQGTVPLKA
ncbi:hypothetical protein CIP107534_01418 [Corynebacterium diphtheriae]|nr:hypothetical protein CIP107534_01418 [Corynebacterium diphtheriae]